MQLNYDGIELPINRVNSAYIHLNNSDTLTLSLGGSEVLVKFENGHWAIFCNEKISINQEGTSGIETGFSV